MWKEINVDIYMVETCPCCHTQLYDWSGYINQKENSPKNDSLVLLLHYGKILFKSVIHTHT